MNHKVKIVLIALSLSMTGSSIVLLSQESKTGNAKVNFLLGKAHVQKPGKNSWEPLKSNDPVYEGDLISTGNGSRVTVLYRGSEFKIQQNSKIRLTSLHEESKNGRLEIDQGFAWFKIVNLKGKKFDVATSNSTAGVRGTSFSVSYDPKTKDSSFCTCEGKVTISDSNGKEILQEKGKGTIVFSQNPEMKKVEYEGIIKKLKTLPSFEARLKKNLSLKNCLSCHTPEGWTPSEDFLKDETYGKQ
ncbi:MULTISPECIES: FecR domain-containing protein [Leptospira]|uniref:Sigma factor regulatory protein, FecR/PupR family n=5 Tax=Leptospira borgpetersenii TaxID=174 RepID=M3HT85_LEPBO|nr:MULTISPECIES: FecR family protein [Leptospira]EMG01271.1 sigma factor regulatory protein, FecR/PupR family [Leptospira borgpetersenii str. 200701203]EMO08491.1 sigma factor regulatory protein, FecR/PupR family [Leptospira borgpetersenii str. Noumea 25]ALO25040.1 sigma factor regulatory protein, FecR/PupR family [Leptospira borgpetersenii serovar Ballum]ANH00044.2 Sigma factor regulatory protein, FecR/PupR family [Leptospira borgpetersenii str. 4E]AXX15498.1 iron dicitrate transport regulato